MIRIAAAADLHFDRHSAGRLLPHLRELEKRADFFLLGGDLTQSGEIGEAEVLAEEIKHCPIPVLAVLGNHDYHLGREHEIQQLLKQAGVQVLEGAIARFNVRGHSVGVAGMKGFGGGFFGACITEFGEPEMKAFARHTRMQAAILKQALASLDTDFRFALTHFSPIEGTLLGERREIYPFLGSYLLAEVMDACGVQGAFHGHAHSGTEKGATRGGIPVRNVAQPVIRHCYHIYHFEEPVVHAALPSETVFSLAPPVL